MIGSQGNLAALAASTQIATAAEDERNKQEKQSAAADVLDGIASGVDVVDLGVQGCKAVANAMQPSHVTGGKETPAGFVTGGGDGVGNAFETVSDCTPVVDATEAVAESAGFIADAASAAGEIVSGAVGVAGDIVGGIVGGVFDGL